MTKRTIRVGMMSFAHGHAHSYTTCLQRLSGVEIVGIYDNNVVRGQEAAQQYGIPFFASAQNLLDLGLDGVIICPENAHHRSLVELAAGKTGAILCEKPIATTLADAQAMIHACARAGARLQVAFPVRFSPPIQQLKEVLARGDLGRIFSAKCTNHGAMPGGWFVDPALAGGGAVMDHTVHVIDLLRWFWQAEVVEVYAEVGYNLLQPELGLDDVGLLSFQMSNGVYGTLDTSWSRPKSYPTGVDVKIEVIGEKGAVAVDAFRQRLSVSSDDWGQTRWVHWGSDMNMGLIKDFIEMIRSDRQPFITGNDGLKALEVALAAYRSAETGAPVRLPLNSD